MQEHLTYPEFYKGIKRQHKELNIGEIIYCYKTDTILKVKSIIGNDYQLTILNSNLTPTRDTLFISKTFVLKMPYYTPSTKETTS